MSRSYAETMPVVCDHCGQACEHEIWLIVDLAERPDLAERIRAGSLHRVRCPHCGGVQAVDAPLLVHDGERQRLLFAMPGGAALPHHQSAAVLAARLAETFPESAPAYLGEVGYVAGERLGAALDGGDPALPDLDDDAAMAELMAALESFVDLDAWSDRHRFAEVLPLLLEDGAGGLGDLFRAAGREGGACEVAVPGAEAVAPELCDDVCRAKAAAARYAAGGDLSDLHAACAAWQGLWSQAAFETAPATWRVGALSEAGGAFLQRYWADGDVRDLDMALDCCACALEAAPADSPDRPSWLNNLGITLSVRYGRHGEQRDAERALAAFEEAVAATPAGVPERAAYLANLGNGLLDRYGRAGDVGDLERALAVLQEAATAALPDAPERAAYLDGLGNAWSDRYGWTGEPADLDQALNAYEAALAATLQEAPERATRLNNLGTGWSLRHACSGEPGDLDRAMAAYEAALAAMPAAAPQRAAALNNLGNGLLARYRRLGEPHDLDRALVALEGAVAQTPSMAPDAPGYLNNLGNGLGVRYERTGELADLDRAVAAYEDALARLPSGAPERAVILHNLGESLATRYERTREPRDLARADAARAAAAGDGSFSTRP